MPPNVLLVVLDTARADALEPYGARPGASPTIAQIAARGRAFDPVHATACWTLPSHVSMLTGLLPRAAGLARAPGGRPEGVPPLLRRHVDSLLPEVLRRAGYATAAVSTNLWVSPATGFDIGFERFVPADGPRQALLHRADARSRFRWARQALRSKVDDGAAEAGRALRSWIADVEPGQPFFWFVNLVECHSPYLPPRPYNRLGPIDRIRAGEEARRHLNLGEIWRTCLSDDEVPAPALERMRDLYAGSIRYMDDWLAGVLEALDERRILDETAVVVTSDHGENLGEGGMIGHAFSLDQRLIRVPLISMGPQTGSASPIGSLAELPAHVAELAGLDRHPWKPIAARDGRADGIAVAQFDPPAGPDDPRAAKAAAMWRLDERGRMRLTSTIDCATDGTLKLLRTNAGESLYDLVEDPSETRPLDDAALDHKRVEVLRRALDRAAADASPSSADAAPDEVTPEERQRLEDRMRLLGYL